MGCISPNSRGIDLNSLGTMRKTPDRTKITTFNTFQNFSFATSQMCGWRQHMEDTMIARCPTHDGSQVSLFAVFDGHGGPQISKYLSENLTNWLYSCPDFKAKRYGQSLKNNFLKIDQFLNSEQGIAQIFKIQLQLKKSKKGKAKHLSLVGSTAVIILITPEEVHVAHTGDSKAVFIKEKIIQFQTTDHKPNHPLELQRINSNGGFIQKERLCGDLSVSRGFGDFHYKASQNPENQIVSPIPEVFSFQRKDVDLIMMGCDGIWQVNETSEIIDQIQQKYEEKKTLTEGQRLARCLEEFMDDNIAKNARGLGGSSDNMSGILIKFQNH